MTEIESNTHAILQSTDEENVHSPFVEANTQQVPLTEIENHHIIPVFSIDNEPTISHGEFINKTIGVAHHIFEGETVDQPQIRVSHPRKGRVPEAKGKPASQLSDNEKTLFYERMAFIIEIPSITQQIDGNRLALTIGGVKGYNLDNLNRRKGSPEHFKVFIGFLNKVCTNLCVWIDGFAQDIQVTNSRDLEGKIYDLISGFSFSSESSLLNRFLEHQLTEQQFAQLIGRARLYQYLPVVKKKQLPEFLLNDTQIATVAKEYLSSSQFASDADGSIDLWRFYNLLTEANKSSYIDTFVDRSVNAFQFTSQLAHAIEQESDFWFLS